MLIIAHHDISDPESFWAAAKDVTMDLPANLKLQGVYPAKDGKTGTCLWEADSVTEVQQFLDKHSAKYARNFCYEVDEEKAMGLPNVHMTEAHMDH
ncbi:hypothetical protein Q4E93_33970 [Flavitalea sp. BT771]|uniref:hypothetical protein n=1 Tax=Flavitalea sp. BT771 TaxID=3063329 RepID=UPI0026E311F1|nr:hypothetical protein [Flavitalea sp. BT771]MDO6435671.1 hypothetical protein [Flavitalea sp. BT771]MDV6224572.1 hypothetical protein [Flavitalea sp. BT771]